MKGKVLGCSNLPAGEARLPNNGRVGKPLGAPNLGKHEAGGIPCQGLPTQSSCSYAAKGALNIK
jgi:hypothetical protein